jgi:hypothetical protein
MNATALAAPVAGERSWTDTLRIALIGFGIVVMIAVAFAVGRVTVGTSKARPVIAPAPVSAPAPGLTSEPACHVARPC